MSQPTFAILITTKNRLDALKLTLKHCEPLLNRPNVDCIICVDGSNDATVAMLQTDYPNIKVLKNTISRGLIYSRNRLMEATAATYAISLDDDLHFITKNPLEYIVSFFSQHPNCAVMTFRIYWNLLPPSSTNHNQNIERVKSFAGGAHVWRMSRWKLIPEYPDWFIFYGEEDFASYHLFKQKQEVFYVPDILCHHRVDLKARKKDTDYKLRLRRSLRAGWYLYVLFFPLHLVPRKFMYSLWIQLKTRVFKGDIRAFVAICQALLDVLIHIPKLFRNRHGLTHEEFQEFSKLADVRLYWTPEDETA